jgi:hypothetical protein
MKTREIFKMSPEDMVTLYLNEKIYFSLKQFEDIIPKSIVLRTVFGGSKEYSVRSLLYPLPNILLQKFIKHKFPGVQVRSEIVFMNNFSAKINKININRVKREFSLFKDYFDKLIRNQKLDQMEISFIEDTIFLDKLLDFVKKNSPSSEMDYWWAHTYVHDLLFEEGELIVNIGGLSEIVFHNFRSKNYDILTKDIAPQVNTFSNFEKPPYYIYSKLGDISIREYALKRKLPDVMDLKISKDYEWGMKKFQLDEIFN